MPRVPVVYCSSYGHIEQVAQAVAEGARSVASTDVIIKRVAELVPEEVARTPGIDLDQEAPIASPNELGDYDAITFGTPTRYDGMAAQMRNFLDQTGGLWVQGALVGKVGSVFASTATQHGGQETTITSFHIALLRHGVIIGGLPTPLRARPGWRRSPAARRWYSLFARSWACFAAHAGGKIAAFLISR
jgi:NAD(P)H dehydrogenase (quinone)